MKITVVGLGYVGLTNAILLAQKNEVTAVDINQERINTINNRTSPIADTEIELFLNSRDLNLFATLDAKSALKDAEYIIVATPTNYDEYTNYFDTSSVENVISLSTKINPNALIVIKSTIPIGFVDQMRDKFKTKQIIFSPEFLREGRALYDNLHPSRIIVGENSKRAKVFAKLMLDCSEESIVPILYTNSKEAEAIKLFSNTYLAMRVAFFNELDSYAMFNSLDAEQIINGICLDNRIGSNYNNPSFGYGGYCLPKDTKQLLANYNQVPQSLIKAIVTSNRKRKDFLADQILNKNPKTVGIYRLVMKADSDNFRQSSIQGIIKRLQKNNIKIIIYEPSFNEKEFMGSEIIDNFNIFKEKAEIIIANRYSSELSGTDKVFTRDIYRTN